MVTAEEARRVVAVALERGWAKQAPETGEAYVDPNEGFDAALAEKRAAGITYKEAAHRTGVPYSGLMKYVWKKQQATLEAGRREAAKRKARA